MARKCRVSVPDGTYHVASRIIGRQHWLKDPVLKDRIVDRLYGIAAFSGVDLQDWTILNNHFHLQVHVPEVPECYRLDPDTPPAAYAFGMRPPEINPPLWHAPTSGDSPLAPGDSPLANSSTEASTESREGRAPSRPQAPGDRPLANHPSLNPNANRPATGFMLSDEEMLERLSFLYPDERKIKTMRIKWAEMRKTGNGAAVDAIKDRYCRRMYNISQFVKTFKECVARLVKEKWKISGPIFETRFYSGLLEGDKRVERFVSLYIAYNPFKAGLVKGGKPYVWSCFGQAEGGGKYAESCRKAYEKLYNRPWHEVRAYMYKMFEQRIEKDKRLLEQVEKGLAKLTLAQAIRLQIPALSRGAFIGRNLSFSTKVLSMLVPKFPCPSFKSLRWLAQSLDWINVA